MELKFDEVEEIKVWRVGSNRTFMELKSAANNTATYSTAGSNRTFMELKC